MPLLNNPTIRCAGCESTSVWLGMRRRLGVDLATRFNDVSITVSFTRCLFLRRTFSSGLKTPFSYIALKGLAIGSLVGMRELRESKSIDRSPLCQIQRDDDELTVEKKNREADRRDHRPESAGAGEHVD